VNPAGPQLSAPQGVLRHLQSYFDGQLNDAKLIAQIEQELPVNAQARNELESLEVLRDRLSGLPKTSAPSYLRERVLSTLEEARTFPAASPRLYRHRKWIMGALAVAAMTTLAFGGFRWLTDMESDSNLELFVADHVSLLHSEQGNLTTDDLEKIETWLGDRVDFALSIPRWSWATPTSGEIAFIQGHRAARIHFNLAGANHASLFIHPSSPERRMESMGAISPRKAIIQEVRGYKVACWGERGLEYVFVVEAQAEDVLTQLKGVG